MYLQSLEILGFKSFAPKTVLNFHKGVTAIVGPNGCGKSNVLDAIRWVLGEQSAKALRGGEMADVIFSGTDSRPALGMAEVSLTFTECEKELGVEWNEVCITRRVFRDGNSEYLLNRNACRLRDIQGLFMDTGVGRSAYSIMEQGKIDAILSSRPEERRSIFEEAAGITKFKSQKKEALRKLEATEANLLRLTDIIKEVKRQIGSLQRQAAKARRYQAMLADLRTIETHHARRQFETLDAQLQAAHAETARLTELQLQQETEIEAQESEAAARREELAKLDEDLSAARSVVGDLRSHIANAEHRIGFNRERATEFAQLIERYERDIAAAEEKLRVQQSQIETTDLELEQISTTLQFEEDRLRERTAAVHAVSAERVGVERKVQEAFASIAGIEHRLSSLRAQIAGAISQRDGSETRLGILADEIAGLARTLERLGAGVAETRDQFEGSSQALAACQQQVQNADGEARALQGRLDEINRELSARQRLLSEKESKLEVLRQLNEAGEGFAAGAQAVLRGLDNAAFFKPAIVGALAAQIEVEPQFVAAIEAALGGNLQAIVLKDAMVAEAMVRTLNAKKWGRASLALREFFPRSPEDRLMPPLPEGAIAWAIDRVKISTEELRPLVQGLLRDVALVDTVETAMSLRGAEGLSFVTLAGEVFSREGILTGGQTGDASGSMLHRKNQVAQLEAEAGQIRLDIAGITARRADALASLETVRARVQEARDETQRHNTTVSTLRGQLAALEREQRDANRKAESLENERGNIEVRHREASDRVQSLEAESGEAEKGLGDFQTELKERQASLETLREREGALTQDLNELRIKVATEKQRHHSLHNQRAPMTARLHELGDFIAQRHRDIESYRAKSAGLGEDSTRIAGEIESARERAAEAEERVAALAGERAGVAGNIEELEATLRILRRQLTDCHDRRGKGEVKSTQLQLRIDSLAEHIRRRYSLEVREFQPDSCALQGTLRDLGKRLRKTADAPPESDVSFPPAGEGTDADENAAGEAERFVAQAPEDGQRIDWTRVEELVRELDGRIDSMGPINIDAIQEYEELEQRHGFLEGQLNDLSNSKTELLDVIAKINATTRSLFAETFEKVRVNFQEMFTELFGGGKANLVLVDESDPLESGIDIIARPPGKQLQSISLLSGGEKTMTAVALLFAIYMVKPSPFCVLDEMDAPLDESNIRRFIKILDRFVSQSQFVVITHNKRTIARADVLYGVTMEEHGVSKLVGVKFARREESTEGTDLMGTANPSKPLEAEVPSVAESFGKSDELHSERAKAG